MAQLTPVDHDPFAPQPGAAATTPVEGDPFAESWSNYLTGLGQQAVEGASFGWAKPFNDLVAPFDRWRGIEPTTSQQIAASEQQFEKAHPVASKVAQAAGAAVPMALGGEALGAAGLAGETTLGQMGAQAALGGAGGAAQAGANAAQGQGSWGQAAADIGLGALGGGVSPLVGKYLLEPGADIVANALYKAGYGKTLPSAAAKPMAGAMEAARQSAQDVGGEISRLGPGATFADTSPQAQSLAAAVAGSPGLSNADRIMQQNLIERTPGLAARAGVAGEAYNPITKSGAVVDLSDLQNSIAQQRADAVIGGVKNEGDINKALAQVRDMLPADPSQTPISIAHNVQHQMIGMGKAASKAGRDDVANALNDARGLIHDAMPPEYNVARRAYAAEMGKQETMQATADQINQAIAAGQKAQGAALAPSAKPVKNLTDYLGGHGGGLGAAALAAHEAGIGMLPAAAAAAGSKLITPVLNESRQAGVDQAKAALARAMTGQWTPELQAAVAQRLRLSQGADRWGSALGQGFNALGAGGAVSQTPNLYNAILPPTR